MASNIHVYTNPPIWTSGNTNKVGLLTVIENPTVARVDNELRTKTIDGSTPVFLYKVAVSGNEKYSLHGLKKQTVSGYVKKSDFDQMNVSTVPIPANFAGLEAEMVPTRLEKQLFRIYEVTEDEDCVTIVARHVWYDNLQNYTLWKPEAETAYTGAAVCRNILGNAISPVQSDVASDCTDTKNGDELDYERKNLVEAFLDPEKGVCAKFGLSLIRDNWDFYCLKEVGYDRGFVIQNGKNLLGVERVESIENVVTRIAPFAKKGNEIVWYNQNGVKWVDSPYIGDYSHPRVEILDTGITVGKDGVTDDNVQQKLREAAQKRFTDDKADIPEVEMTIEFLSLGDTEEYAQYRGLDKVYLYDIVTIKDTVRGYEYSAQVVGVEHDILTGMLNSVTLGKLQNSDGVRKIAVWQVPEVDGTNIRLLSIQAGSFAPEAIQRGDLAPRIITADLIESGEVRTEHLQAGAVTTEKLEAEAVTAGKIQAGAVTTEKLDAYAVTTAKLAAGAVTTDKLDAGAVTADKISATDLDAINAKLGTATIANAQIAIADINFAHIKDLNAQSAYFGQTIFDEGIGGKLYVPRLNVGYAQMVGATIGDLVIQASNGNYYGIDVDMNGNVTATQRTVSASEIAAGHTTDGRTLVLGTDILATDLTTENIYASHALMNEITAATLNVDELWARQAFIGKLMTTDISSNTYIQATIGNWQSGSTITQTINSLDSRISSLGYGTVYFQADEPDHGELTAGDIWIQSTSTGSWNTVKTDYSSWNEIYATVGTWQTVGGIPKMFVWDGRFWQEMYDALLPITLETEIQQLANEIALRATKTEVDALSNDVQEFSAELTIQAQEIQSAVSAVNLKAASYVMQADPRTAYTVSVGDMWIRTDGVSKWSDVSSKYATWNDVKTTYEMWQDLIASQTFVWNGVEWIETSDRAAEIYQKTLIDQTINQVTILAEASAEIGDDLVSTKAQLTITNSAIQQEVQRATTAEGGKLDKTTQYQTADAIVTEAVSRAASNAIAKTATYQTADSIVTEAVRQSSVNAASGYIAKTTTYQSASAIVNTAVSQAGTNANNTYIKKSGSYTSVDAILAEAQSMATLAGNDAKGASIAKTTSYQTADAIVNAAMTYTNGKLGDYSTTAQTSTMIAQYVGNNAYGKVSGITITSAGVDISGSQYVKIASGGYFRVTSGNFGIKSDAGTNEYVIWSGASTAAASQFRVKKNGEVTLTKLMILNESGQETEVNLRTYGLWKLNYHVVKSYTTNSITLSNGAVVNFNTAAGVVLSGGWTDGWTRYTVTAVDSQGNVVGTKSSGAVAADMTNAQIKSALESASNHKATLNIEADGEVIVVRTIDASGVYTQGENAGANGVGLQSITLPATATADVSNKTLTALATVKLTNGVEEERRISMFDPANGLYDTGYSNGSPASGSASGRSGSSYSWTFRITKGDGSETNLSIDCSSIYSDARQGYTQGIFSQYSGAQLYTIGQSGPQRYTGTLYVKS